MFLLLLTSLLFADESDDRRENYFLQETPASILPTVDPVTGTYLEEATDLVVAGVEPIAVSRFYCSLAPTDDRCGNWLFNPETYLAANFEWKQQEHFVSVGSATGGILKLGHGNLQEFVSHSKVSNLALSGQSHPLNTKLKYTKRFDTKNHDRFQWVGTIEDGTGTVRHFSSAMHEWFRKKTVVTKKKGWLGSGETITTRFTPNKWTPYYMLISGAELPNGNSLHYEAESWKDSSQWPHPELLKSITAKNRHGEVLGWVKFDYVRDSRHREIITQINISTSDKRKMTVHQSQDSCVTMRSVERPGQPRVSYSYRGRQLVAVTYPDGRVVTTDYDAQGRVHRQTGPLGLLATYTYNSDHTIVTDGEGRRTLYRFDAHKRVISIETADAIEKRVWSDEGDLLRHEIFDTSGTSYLSKSYRYQDHNPIEEHFQGHTIYRTFQNNRLVEEISGTRRKSYTYRGSLLIEESLYDESKLLCRTSHTYDDSACLIRTMSDDGVSGRVITIEPKRSLPHYGLPESVTERDLEGNLIKKVVYSYTSFGKICSEKHYDAHSKERYTIKNRYDERERLIATTDALGQTTGLTYDVNNNLTSITQASSTKYITYDKANQPIELIDGDLVIKRLYNKTGQLVAETNPSGCTTHYRYNAAGRLHQTTHPDGATQSKEYNPLGDVIVERDCKGYVIKTIYNERSQPTQISYPDGSAESFTYDCEGRQASYRDKNGAMTDYRYDGLGNRIVTQQGEKRIEATYVGHSLLSQKDPEGYATHYTYNAQGQKIQEEREGRTTHYAYDALGRCTETMQGEVLYSTSYDLLNRPLYKETRAAKKTCNHIEYTYDEAGNESQISYAKGRVSTTYNRHNQPIVVEDALGNQTHLSYKNGLLIGETNPHGTTTHWEYDECNRVCRIYRTDPAGGTIQASEKSYDCSGNCVGEGHTVYRGTTPLNTITHSFSYGPMNRLESMVEAGQKRTSWGYDSKGRVHTLTYPNGSQHHHDYDEQGRLTRYAGPDFDYRYSYNKNDAMIKVIEALTNQTTERAYNGHNQVISERLGNGALLLSRYNERGQRTELVLSDKSAIHFSYSGDSLQAVERNGYTHTYRRDDDGEVIGAELANGERMTIKRDKLGRPVQIKAPCTALTYSYDGNGNLLTSNDTVYLYDALDQLVGEGDRMYAYDSLSNRLSPSYSINDLCQLSIYAYDGNGNMHLPGYVYDSQNRLTKACGVTYTYDSFHRRLTKRVNGSTTCYLWDGDNEIGSFTTRLKELRVLGEGLGAEIGAAVLVELGDEMYVPIHDHRGSLKTLLSVDNKTAHSFLKRLLPFLGNPVTFEFSAYGEGEHKSTWTFSSKRYDSETGLLYFGRRYYMPSLGRWLTADPAGFRDGPNLYAYVHGNPHHLDLYGLEGVEQRNIFSPPALIGWRLTQSSLTFFNPKEPQNYDLKSLGYDVKDLPSGFRFGFANGLNNKLDQAVQHTLHFSNLSGGYNVDLAYNPTNGWRDYGRAALEFLGGSPFKQVHQLHQLWDRNYEAGGANSLYVQFCTSEAVIQVKQALQAYPEERRARIRVIAIAPAAYISEDLCHSVHHYRTRAYRDFVPHLDRRGQKLYKGTITTVPSHQNAPWFDHSFSSPTYVPYIRNEIEDYLDLVGAL